MAPELAVGLVLLAASPGGATANIYGHLANGDVALNITLTAVDSVLALLTLPLIVSWALARFMGQEQSMPPPARKVLEVAAIIVVPVLIGMALRATRSALAAKAERPLRIFSILALAGLIAATIAAK